MRPSATANFVMLACVVAFVGLGAYVSHRPPVALDRFAYDAFRGRGLALATALTQLGRFPAYVSLVGASLVAALLRPRLLRGALAAGLGLLAAWIVSDRCKDIFDRPRPPAQLVFHETSLSYPSGHATLVLTYYGIWALVAWRSALPAGLRIGLVAAAALLVLGTGWARLALGAHYLTDVAGGYLLGGTFVAFAATLLGRFAPLRSLERSQRI